MKNRSMPTVHFFAEQDPSKYIDRVMELSNVSSITMTNPVFDDNERNRWLKNPSCRSGPAVQRRCCGSTRSFGTGRPAAKRSERMGYKTVRRKFPPGRSRKPADSSANGSTGMKAIYLAVSLPPEFRYPAGSDPDRIGGTDDAGKGDPAGLRRAADFRLP